MLLEARAAIVVGAASGLWLRAAVAERQYGLASRWMRLRAGSAEADVMMIREVGVDRLQAQSTTYPVQLIASMTRLQISLTPFSNRGGGPRQVLTPSRETLRRC
jgi:hypothetical protein